MLLGGGKAVGGPEDGGGGGGDHLAHLCGHGGFEHVEGAGGQHIMGEARTFGALGDADGGLMEHDIDTGHGFSQQLGIANITGDDGEGRHGVGEGQVLDPPTDEVVVDDDFGRGLIGDKVRNM